MGAWGAMEGQTMFISWQAGRMGGDDLYSWGDAFDTPEWVTSLDEWNDWLSLLWG